MRLTACDSSLHVTPILLKMLCIAVVLFAIVLRTCLAAHAETRVAVIASQTAGAEKLAPLVELRLGQQKDIVLLEREKIQEIFREQELQTLTAAEGTARRVSLGKLLNADLLVFLVNKELPKPHTLVVVCETHQGLRLRFEPVLPTASLEADADAVMKQIEAAVKKRQEKIVDVVAVPPLLNSSLTHDADHLQGALARLVECDLLLRPGVMVVELAEAKALAQEMAIGGAGVERRLPLYLMGDYRFDGTGDNRRGQFTWRLLRGTNELDRRHDEGLTAVKMPGAIQRTAVAMVDKALGKRAEPSDPKIETMQLNERLRAFLEIGAWPEALALAEASLMLRPDQAAVHGNALLAMIKINDARDSLKAANVRELSPKQALEILQWLHAALPHLEAFFLGTELTEEHDWYVYHPWGQFRCPATPEVQAASQVLYRDRQAVADRVLAAKAAAKIRDYSLPLLFSWTEPPLEPPVGAEYAQDLLEASSSKSTLAAAWDVWLKKNLTRTCRRRLQLLEDFIWLTDDRKNPHRYTYKRLIWIHVNGSGADTAMLITDPLYVEYLTKVEKLPNSIMQEEAKFVIEWIKSEPERLAKLKESQKKWDEQSRAVERSKQPPPPVENPEVVFHPLRFKFSPASGKRQQIIVTEASDEKVPGDNTTVDSPVGCIVSWFTAGTDCDVVCGYNGLALMKQKDRFTRLPLETAQSAFIVKNSSVEGRRRYQRVSACWDGRYVWAFIPGEKGSLAVIDPKSEKVWKYGPDSNLPPSVSGGIVPLGSGKVCLAGHFGRFWIALAAFDPDAGMKLEVIHEARLVPENTDTPAGRSAAAHSPNTAAPVESVLLATAPDSGDGDVQQRVIVVRSQLPPLLVDPKKRSVTAMNDIWSITCMFGHDGAIYGHQNHSLTLQPLYRCAFPDFKKELANPAASFDTCVFHEGRFHAVASGTPGISDLVEYYVMSNLKDPPRRLRCELHASNSHAEGDLQLSRSNFYGLILSSIDRVFRVEVKGLR